MSKLFASLRLTENAIYILKTSNNFNNNSSSSSPLNFTSLPHSSQLGIPFLFFLIKEKTTIKTSLISSTTTKSRNEDSK